MFQHGEAGVADGSGQPEPPPSDGTSRRPNLAGDLEALFGPRPLFRTALRGYDRLQVDNYVAWAESELGTTRRENEDLLARYGACSAELELSQRLLACSPEGREMVRTSERVGEILRLAADEAAQLTEAGQVEADRIRGQARSEADLLLRRAREVKDAAVAEADRIQEEAQRVREDAASEWELAGAEAVRMREEAAAAAAEERRRAAEEAAATKQAAGEQAAEELRRARATAARVRAEAEAEARRLTEQAAAERAREAAEAAARISAQVEQTLAELAETCTSRVEAAQARFDDLVRRRTEARAALRRLTGQIGDALGTLSGVLAAEDEAERAEQGTQGESAQDESAQEEQLAS
ncbi:DivIVA domain-containing protein [Geodermatophilus sp. SYSU D00703]